ncbi:MAG: hypothetical protein BGO69_05400 [Bacteroidetes bacterium 46-16]|nr:MAG: hypothetical protein BGO69_05400 [Bacteroidetes bacterium 46-16]
MREQIVAYKGVELIFVIYDGTVQGYNKFLETTTNIQGGGGRIYTNQFTERVQGKIKPVKSETRHKYITEFSVVEDDGKEVSVRLINNASAFRDGQSVSVWIENNGKRVYKIINYNIANTTSVNSIKDIVKSNNYYFNEYLKANFLVNILWRLTQVAILALIIWFTIDIFKGKDILATIIGFAVIIIPVILIYRLIKNLIKSSLIKGLKQMIKGR